MRRRNYYLSPGELGHGFENKVKNTFERNSYVLIKKNQWNKNYAPEKDKASKREYDLVMFNLRDKQVYIIECKAHYSPNNLVSLNQIKEFNNKLENYDGKHAIGMMVTDTYFTIPVKRYASNHSIVLVNGKELGKMEKKPGGTMMSIASRMISSELENLVNKLIKNYSS